VARLDERSRATGQTRSQITKTLLEEGLRMEAHPGVVFRPGPAGRRPGLVGGPDIWEVARLFQDRKRLTHDVVDQIADELNLSVRQIEAALGYYAEFKDEIDHWIDRIDAQAERAESAFHRRQSLLQA